MGDHRDLSALLALAHDKSGTARKSLVAAVTDLYFDDIESLAPREEALVTDILHRLIHDVEITVRRALADRLAIEPNAPRLLVSELANDDIGVAFPILQQSTVLADPELVAIVHRRSRQHARAIALRRRLSETVTDALVSTDDTEVIRTVLGNQDAEISNRTMAFLVERSKHQPRFHEPLLRREDLPPELACRMYWWVSAALRQHILSRFEIDPSALDDAMADAVSAVVPNSRQAQPRVASGVADLANKMVQEHGNSADLLIQSLRSARVALFEALLARMATLPGDAVHRFAYRPGGEALAVICKAVDIEDTDFASIFLLSRQACPGDKAVDPRETSQVLDLYEHLGIDVAKEALSSWRREPQYLGAVRALARRGRGGARRDAARP